MVTDVRVIHREDNLVDASVPRLAEQCLKMVELIEMRTDCLRASVSTPADSTGPEALRGHKP